MNIYKIEYRYNNKLCWVFIKADTEQEAKQIYFDSINHPITFMSLAYEHQIVRSDITLNFSIDFEKDYIFG